MPKDGEQQSSLSFAIVGWMYSYGLLSGSGLVGNCMISLTKQSIYLPINIFVTLDYYNWCIVSVTFSIICLAISHDIDIILLRKIAWRHTFFWSCAAQFRAVHWRVSQQTANWSPIKAPQCQHLKMNKKYPYTTYLIAWGHLGQTIG